MTRGDGHFRRFESWNWVIWKGDFWKKNWGSFEYNLKIFWKLHFKMSRKLMNL